MPCQSYGEDYSAAYQWRAEANQLTDMLCRTCAAIEKSANTWVLPKDVEKWWEEHKRLDAKREAKKAKDRERAEAKKKALNKLTKEERRLLGIKED